MKKILSIILVLAIILSLPSFVFAENNEKSDSNVAVEDKAFDLSVLEGSTLYNYDKFSKEWRLWGCYEKNYSDGPLSINVCLFPSYIEKRWGPEIRFMWFDSTKDQYDLVDEFYALVDDTLYSFEKLQLADTNSYLMGGTVAREFLNSLKDAKEVAFKLHAKAQSGTQYSLTIDEVPLQELSELIEIADLLERSNAWETDENPALSDNIVKASID